MAQANKYNDFYTNVVKAIAEKAQTLTEKLGFPSSKRVVNTEHYTIPTNLGKAKTYLTDEYLKEIKANSDQQYFFLRAKCYHSFKKSEAPHVLRFALCIVSGQLIEANCSCKAGKVGFCNHMLALTFKTCKFSLFDSKALMITVKALHAKMMMNSQMLHARHSSKNGIKTVVVTK